MLKTKFHVHIFYCFLILLMFLIGCVVLIITDNKVTEDHVNGAAALASIILAVVAIIQTQISGRSVQEAADAAGVAARSSGLAIDKMMDESRAATQSVKAVAHDLKADVQTEIGELRRTLDDQIDRIPDTIDKLRSSFDMVTKKMESYQELTRVSAEGPAPRGARTGAQTTTGGLAALYILQKSMTTRRGFQVQDLLPEEASREGWPSYIEGYFDGVKYAKLVDFVKDDQKITATALGALDEGDILKAVRGAFTSDHQRAIIRRIDDFFAG